MKEFLHLASPIATFVGLLLSTWGSYRLMLFYHPFRGPEFWRSLRTVALMFVTFRFTTLKRKIRIEARSAKSKKENRVDSLAGIYLLFWGFALQVFGAICWCIDSKMDLAVK